jgi:predicted nucleic acid-binding protein
MNLLETNFLVDYEKGRSPAMEWYQEHAENLVAASTMSMFELAFSVVETDPAAIDVLQESLEWVDFLPLSVSDAIEAARIDTELQGDGQRIPIGDTVIAGVARNREATLVAADSHFDRIDGLDVVRYRN